MSEVPIKYPQISSRRQPLWHSKAQRKARIKDGTSSEETVSICQNNSLQVLVMSHEMQFLSRGRHA
ncbi:hypothetical protein Taro_012051 [Colocasia esculenta]|uniref:Uncharacterized protein n=1 Tax=Colocasia esculenta TaxID=4460 RepID=A0A843U304_COLES|nr:hypothetical protein [Colocasia esculenta]